MSGGGPNGKFGGIFGNGKEKPNKAAGLYWDTGTAAHPRVMGRSQNGILIVDWSLRE